MPMKTKINNNIYVSLQITTKIDIEIRTHNNEKTQIAKQYNSLSMKLDALSHSNTHLKKKEEKKKPPRITNLKKHTL